jgi:acyl-CoA synthetase (AMP-forming)/AMP-acid ligase II
VIKPGETAAPAEIIAFCQSRLARSKSPKEVRIVPCLPKSPIGKILRQDLRKEAHTPS